MDITENTGVNGPGEGHPSGTDQSLEQEYADERSLARRLFNFLLPSVSYAADGGYRDRINDGVSNRVNNAVNNIREDPEDLIPAVALAKKVFGFFG